jgi:hypothetical protein
VTLEIYGDATALVCSAEGPALDVAGATDLVGEALSCGAEWVCIPASRLDPTFFRLRTGVAGEIAQKFANYRLRVAIVGDIGAAVAASSAFRDYVTETNRGRDLWFVPTAAEFVKRLTS